MQWSNAVAEHVDALAPVAMTEALALKLLSMMDLTSLNGSDSEQTMAAFLDQAATLPAPIAAICVWPQFVQLAHQRFQHSRVKIASVANFPEGTTREADVLVEIGRAIEAGANEIDVVFPYQRYLSGDRHYAADFVAACKAACGSSVLLKVILETGALRDTAIIADASYDAIVHGADFIKTSTGKIIEGASLEAAGTMLLVIKHIADKVKRPVGLKVSGGIRETQQAACYLSLTEKIMGANWATPATFRIGASQLAKELLKVLGG